MALIKCPECGNDISDIAESCPKCGRPTGIKKKRKSPWLAAILNLLFWFPGYFYVGENLLGVIFLLIVVESIVLYSYLPSNYTPVGAIFGILEAILLSIDGYKRVVKYNKTFYK